MIKTFMARTASTLALAALLVGCASHSSSDPFAVPAPQGQYVATEAEHDGKVEASRPDERMAFDFEPNGKVTLSYDAGNQHVAPVDGTYVFDGSKITVTMPQRTMAMTARKYGSFTLDAGGILILFRKQ